MTVTHSGHVENSLQGDFAAIFPQCATASWALTRELSPRDHARPAIPRHTARFTLRLALTREALHMTSNAGIKRNRRPRGLPVVRTEIRLSPETDAKLDAARRASGQLSLSLYIERLVAGLEAEHGSLPVLSPTLDGTEEAPKIAAA